MMPSFVPRGLEPYQKRELLDKRLTQLRAAVATGGSPARVARAAEKVRAAALAAIKAERALLGHHLQTGPPQDPNVARRLDNLAREAELWASLTAEAIVQEHAS